MLFAAGFSDNLDTMRLLLRQGDLHRLMGRWDDALNLFGQVLASPSLRHDAVILRLQTLLEAGRFQDGLQEADASVDHYPNCGKVHLFRARLNFKLQRIDFAAIAYRVALEFLDPPLAEHYIEAARVLALTPGHGASTALRLVEAGLRNLGPDVELMVDAFELEMELGHFEQAAIRLRQLLTVSSEKQRLSKEQICKRLLVFCKGLPQAHVQKGEIRAIMQQLQQYAPPQISGTTSPYEDAYAITY